MTRTATYNECYTALRQNGVDLIAAVLFAVLMVIRNTQIEE